MEVDGEGTLEQRMELLNRLRTHLT
jgi:hypothetical protein